MFNNMIRRSGARKSAAIVGGLGVVAASMLAAAPMAAAAGPGISIQPGAGANNDRYGQGCSYAVTVTVDQAGPVSVAMAENVAGSSWEPLGVLDATAPGAYVIEWIPERQGSFRLNANQAGEGTSTHALTVTRGINLGSSTCLVL